VLFLHEVHAAIGEREIDVDDAVRDIYAPQVADDDTRLLWYLYATHGAGDAYHTVMITALRDGAAWERLSRRLRYGDLADWLVQIDSLTYSSHSRLMVSTDWSPLAGLELDSVPTDLVEHDVRVYREDTLEGVAVDAAISGPEPGDDGVLSCIAGFRPLFAPEGTVRVLYRVGAPEVLDTAFATDAGWGDWSGSLTPTLPAGVHGSTRMLRNVPWSPLA
jgi:hypothetical protein